MTDKYTSPEIEIVSLELDIITFSSGTETPDIDLGFGDW